jgi:hypothetical protein
MQCPVTTLQSVANIIGIKRHTAKSWLETGVIIVQHWTVQTSKDNRYETILVAHDWIVDGSKISKFRSYDTTEKINKLPRERLL